MGDHRRLSSPEDSEHGSKREESDGIALVGPEVLDVHGARKVSTCTPLGNWTADLTRDILGLPSKTVWP